jgi:branched-chain amino acid transport system permease protein
VLQLLLNGLAMGAIYALVALGLLQIFNAVRIVNFGQGQLLMVGAFFGLTALVQAELPVWLAYPLVLVGMALIGLVFMLVSYYPLRGKPFYLIILTTIAMGIVLENLALIIWGPLPQAVPSPFGSTAWQIGHVTVSLHVLFVFAVTAALLGAQWWFLTRTAYGRMMQATSQDMEMARLVGVRVRYTIAGAFALSAIYAGVGGLLAAPMFLAEPSMGGSLGLKAYVVSVIGGFGNLPGAVIGGLLLGVLETMAAGYISSNYRDAYAFIIMVAMLFFWPRGMFGEKVSERV